MIYKKGFYVEGKKSFSHLVLVEVCQRLNDSSLSPQLPHEVSVVVVGLDGGRGVGGQPRGRLDQVRTEGALAKHHVLGVQLEAGDHLMDAEKKNAYWT